ncbi:MAG: DUF3842 family protein [Clostridia bacterium]|nr:DUF3842 family protein [Clostridia bacterium]
MLIVVMDAQGGGVGKLVVEQLKRTMPEQTVTAVGANALATAAMLRAGADQGATGENAVRVTAQKADVIIAPIGMVLCDAMLGEVTAAMACAVGASSAHKILLPMNRCSAVIPGYPRQTMQETAAAAVQELQAYIASRS